MFLNNIIIHVEGKEKVVTDFFYYNEEKHYLNYHSPYQAVNICTIPDVECEIEIDKPIIYVYAKPIKEG